MHFEKSSYWFIWISAIIYALLKFIQTSENDPHRNPHDYELGFSFLDRMKDNTDLEWTILTSLFKQHYVLLLFQVVAVKVLSKFNRKREVLPIYYAAYSLYCFTLIIGFRATLVLIIYIFLMYIIHTFGEKKLCYISNLCAFLFLDGGLYHGMREKLHLNDTQTFLFDVAIAWMIAKCISFSIDRIECGISKRVTLLEIIKVSAYCLYLPTAFTGPILSYETFYTEMNKPSEPVLCKTFLFIRPLHFFYLIAWYFVYELLLHFVYSSAIQFYPDLVNVYDSWSLLGLGYALPMMFHLKYFIIYGIAGSIANMENITMPSSPKCISCIHTSSFLYRHFDRGLYLWILRYLYHPLVNGRWNNFRKMYALSLCFSFVCVWHGMGKSICVWTVLNYFLVCSEILVHILSSTAIGKFYKEKSVETRERLAAAISTPHFILMCISSVFFLANCDIGMLLIRRILFGGFLPSVPLLVVMYCGCHVSMESKKYQKIN